MAEPASGLGSTTLPEEGVTRSRRPLVAAGVAVVVAVIAVAVIAVSSGGSSKPTVAGASVAGSKASAPVFANSGTTLTNADGVQKDVKALLAHTLPRSAVTPAIPSGTPATPATGSVLSPTLLLSDPALPGCVSEIESGGSLLGIDRVTYQSAPSLLIVTSGDTADQAIAWIVGPRCAQPGTDGIRTIVTTVR